MPKISDSLDGEFLAAIAKQPNEILKCSMYLSSAISMAQPNSSGHAEAEVATASYHGAAIRMKTTAALPTAA